MVCCSALNDQLGLPATFGRLSNRDSLFLADDMAEHFGRSQDLGGKYLMKATSLKWPPMLAEALARYLTVLALR